ncbi:3-oxoacyl-ACP synthase III family protein [Streptomyces rimosus]|uniref:3-oxoacyl-ACP synthase III family protein n=1 Tax=Streptomyces rimosus TaxID=1927 RepID=UPI0004C5FACD|nr:3-oxoacyl-ACP synthase III family protein [Streptomyces rimosus]
MTHPCITAVGTALPGPAIDNDRLTELLGVNREWVDAFIGTKTRHFAVDLATGEQHSTLTDLAERAAANAMQRAGVRPRSIDFIVLATASPDELMPATVNRVADRLGLNQIPTYQLQSGCAGAIQALDLGSLLLQRPGHRTGLVIGGDVCAKHLRLDRDVTRLPSHELVNYVLFGDGAGAAVLSGQESARGMALHTVLNQFTGLGQPAGQVIRWFGAAERTDDAIPAEEDYKAIEQRVPELADEVLWQLLETMDWAPEDLSYVLPPQLSGRMTRRIAERLRLPDAREISCVADTGNNGNALPFFQLERLAGQLRPGERALAICVESSKWLKGGFALEGR